MQRYLTISKRSLSFVAFLLVSACGSGGSSEPPPVAGGETTVVQPPASPGQAIVPTARPSVTPTAHSTVMPSTAPTTLPTAVPTTVPTSLPTALPTTAPTPSAAPTLAAPPSVTVPAGFTVGVVAQVRGAHGLAFVPDGDLIVGTSGSSVSLVPQADSNAGKPHVFATFADSPSYGVAYANASIYVATQSALWRIPYQAGAQTAGSVGKIAIYRQGPIAPNSDGDVHRSASVAVARNSVFVGIGSSCNACTEVDPTRATVQRANLDGTGMVTYATRIRNAIALTTNPMTGTVWAGGAGQDNLPLGHPYEYLDSLTLHAPVADYGWPACEENQHGYTPGANCTSTVIPRIELPAYSTIMGAAFYPVTQTGPYAFPAAYRGGVFVGAHGSWHRVNGALIPPHVVYVPVAGDTPQIAVNWSDPTAQWSDFLAGFQDASGNRVGRPSGVAVGPNGSLFVSDDVTGNIYRIRPR